jgi:hypothetical protein
MRKPLLVVGLAVAAAVAGGGLFLVGVGVGRQAVTSDGEAERGAIVLDKSFFQTPTPTPTVPDFPDDCG